MSKSGSLKHQAAKHLSSLFRPGVSRHALKAEGTARQFITSYATKETYIKQVGCFCQFAQKEFFVRQLEQLTNVHVNAYIDHMKSQKWSAFSQKTAMSAICKLLGTTATDYAATEVRHRADITRSRGEKASDRNFSESNNQSLVDFAKATGLRRHELAGLRPNERVFHQGQAVTLNRLERDEHGKPILRSVRGKGGKLRDVPIITDKAEEVAARISSTPDGEKVWACGIPVHMDVHSYRAAYATKFYLDIARDPANLPRKERYDCREDRAGEHFDRAALKRVSKALGHNRISEIPQSYLRL